MSRIPALRAVVLLAGLVGALIVASPAPGLGGATPTVATPAASPVAATGCAALEPYFAAVADLMNASEGLAMLRAAGFDAQALSDADAQMVVEELDRLIAAVAAITPPEPARDWHTAYLDLLGWYREMAATRDPLALQPIINNDRQLFGNLGMAQLAGQTACGYATWTAAWEGAFGTPTATPAA